MNFSPFRILPALLVMLLAVFPIALAGEATETVTLTWESEGRGNTLRLLPRNGQQFGGRSFQGATCAVILNVPPPDVGWRFDIPDEIWFDRLGDAFLTVDYHATNTLQVHSVQYDSGLHRYLNLSGPEFAAAIREESDLETTHTETTSRTSDWHRRIFSLRKARFGNRTDGAADFKITNNPEGVLGIKKITILLNPLPKRIDPPPISFDRCFAGLYRKLWNRLPTPKESAILRRALISESIDLYHLLGNFLKHWEFQDRNVFPFEKTEGIVRLFRVLCGRRPTIQEINQNRLSPFDRNHHWDLFTFLQRYYGEILVHLLIGPEGETP